MGTPLEPIGTCPACGGPLWPRYTLTPLGALYSAALRVLVEAR